MKLLPAKHIIHEALNRGDIKSDSIIVSTSSGTFALGVGTICCELGLPFKIFGDPAIDEALKTRLEMLGGEAIIITKSKTKGAYQNERLNALKAYISQEKLAFWTQQYDNLDNTRSYEPVGEQLLSTLGKNITLVGSVGSGGSTCGIISTLRNINPDAQLIGVDTFNSVLFGQADGPRELRGLGNSILPKNLNHTLFDEVHWVSAKDAIHHAHTLLKDKALFHGPTSGAAYQVARYLALQNQKKIYAFIAPDQGDRYVNSAYNKNWLNAQPFYHTPITSSPKEISHPLNAVGPWCFMKWNRRRLSNVIKHK